MRHSQRWRFGPFEVDAAEHRLLREGVPVPVTRKAFGLLAELLRRPGRLITKAELFETVWAGTVVTDSALSRVIRELRVALGDDAAAPRYIATAHGLGFRFVAVVAFEGAREPAGTVSEPQTHARPRLFGRERDLGRLDRALVDARAGRRGLVFVTGEAGIGKTALVEAFLDRHASADIWSAQGRCIEQYGEGEAYLPILEALEQLSRVIGIDTFRTTLMRYAPAWLAQLPWLAHDADPEQGRRSAGESTPARMLREIAQVLEVLAAERPIALWLEDLHWADPSSLAVIAFLAGRREPARLLIISSFRPVEATASASPLHGLSRQLVQRGQAESLQLGPLDSVAIGQYLRSRFERADPKGIDALSAFLFRRTEGHALFMLAMVSDLVRRGRIVERDGRWLMPPGDDTLADELPDDLRELVRDQIERLSETDRRLVEAAAVVGADFNAAAVASALPVDTAEVEDRCLRLVEQGRLIGARGAVRWPDGTVSAGFRFLHELYWQGTHERVPEGRRAEWQRRIALRQEAAHGEQAAMIAAELAMRFEVAQDSERAFRYRLLAGGSALSRCAYGECVTHLRTALACVAAMPPPARQPAELKALWPLGAALMTVQGYASSEVEETYQRALELAQQAGRPSDIERALRGLWNVHFSRSDLQRARSTAEDLLARAETAGEAGPTFDALAKLGHTCLHRGEFEESRQLLKRALAMPGVSGSTMYRREAPRLLAYLSWTLWYLGLPTQALLYSRRSIATMSPDAGMHTHALVLGHASFLHWLRGEPDEAAALAERQRQLGIEHDLKYWRIWSEFVFGLLAAGEGKVDDGLQAMRAASAAVAALGTVVGTTSWLYLIAEFEITAGRPAAARDALSASSDLLACGSRARNAPETVGIEGLLALAEDGSQAGHARAELRFAASLEIARAQRSLSMELRAAIRLAGLWQGRNETSRAIDLLREVYGKFEEGLETRDLVHASKLLAAWSLVKRDD